MNQEHFVGSQELMGIRIDDTGKGPFHNLATHIALIIFVDKDGTKVRGYETHTDKDGDKVVWEMSAVDDPQHPGRTGPARFSPRPGSSRAWRGR